MTKEQFYQAGQLQFPELPVSIMEKLLFNAPYILNNDISVRWEADGLNWKAWYDFDNDPMPVIIELPIPNMAFSGKVIPVSAFGLADAQVQLNIKGGLPVYKIELKVNGTAYRTIENIPAAIGEAYNCIIDNLPPGEYGIKITDSQTPPAINKASTDWNAVSPPFCQLNGIVNALGLATTVWFEYGETDKYGHTAQYGIVNGITPVNALLKLSAGGYNVTSILVPGTIYHYRIAANNINGTAYGEDMTFTTPALLPVVKTLPVS